MSALPLPKLSKRPTLPLVWVVPFVAFLVGGWMIWREYRHRGPEITIEFADGSGIQAGRTVLEYKGVAVGIVRGVELKDDLSGVIVRLRLDESAAVLASEGAQFWIVQPEFGFSGVRGLETLLTGVRLNVLPGGGPPATHFNAVNRAPPIINPAEGRAFFLQGERLGSLSPGAPVYYREVKVGVVETTRLADNATSVLVRVRVDEQYADLVRINSRFWNAGGASFRIGLRGAELRSTSLASMFTGGVAFATPDTGRELASIAPEGHVFILHGEAERDWLKWQPRIRISPPEQASEAVALPASPPP